MKKMIGIMAVLALALVGGVALRIYQKVSAQPAESIDKIQAREGVPVRVYEVVAEDLARVVSISGEIEALQEVAMAPKVSDRVVKFHVETGQPVAAGDLLAELDTTTSRIEAASAAAALAEAEAQLSKLLNGSRPEEVESARARLAEAEAWVNLRQIEYERQKGLYGERAVPLQRLQEAENQYQMAAAAAGGAKANYELIRKGPREEDIAAARAAVELSRAAAARAQQVLEEHYLRSPCAGVVTRRLAEVGDLVDIRQVVCHVLDMERVYLVLDVSEVHVPHVRVGQGVEVTVDALPGRTFAGKVAEINPQADRANRSFRTKILLENPEHELLPGMFGRAHIVVRRAAGALAAPADALRQDQRGWYVLVVGPEGKAERREVTLGETFDEKVEIKAGLAAGQQVIVLAGEGVAEGARVIAGAKSR